MPDDLDISAVAVDPSSNGNGADRPTAADELIPSVEDLLLSTLIRRGQADRQITLSHQQEEALVETIITDFNDGSAANRAFQQNHLRFTQIWRGIPEAREFPEWGSNVHVALTAPGTETWKSRLAKILFGGDRIAEFTSLDESITPDELNEINDWFNWELKEIVRIKEAFRPVLHQLLVDGFALPVPRYRRRIRHLREEQHFPIQDGVALEDQILRAIKTVFPEQQEVTADAALGSYSLTYTDTDGEARDARIVFRIAHDALVAAIERDEVQEGVEVEAFNVEDLVVVNSAADVEKIPFLGYRFWLSVPDWYAGVKDGTWRNYGREETDRIATFASIKTPEVVPIDTTQHLDSVEGGDSVDSQASDPHRRWLEVYRWEGRWPIGSDAKPADSNVMSGEETGVCVWIIPAAQRVIEIVRLEDLNKDGERSAVKFDFIEQPDRFYSIGFPEWMQHQQAIMDTIARSRIDSGLIATIPFGFYEPAAGFNKEILKMEPGLWYPVKSAQGIATPRLNFNPQWGFSEEGLQKRYADDQSGLGPAASGSFVSKRTSATEFEGTQQSIDLRTEWIAEGLFASLRKLLYRIFGLYQQHMPDGRVFQVTGADGERMVKKFTRDRLHGKMHLQLTGSIQLLSAQLQRDVALNMLSMFMNPILLQLGIVKPETVHAALAKVMRAMGYTGARIFAPDVPPMSDPAPVEHKRMLMGEYPEPSPAENFHEHLAAHMRFATHPHLEQLITPEGQQLLAQHIQQTQQLQQMVQMQRMMQAQQAAQMRANMEQFGIRPGLDGSVEPGGDTGGGSADEGVGGAAGEGMPG